MSKSKALTPEKIVKFQIPVHSKTPKQPSKGKTTKPVLPPKTELRNPVISEDLAKLLKGM
jgi:hypothetical protein